ELHGQLAAFPRGGVRDCSRWSCRHAVLRRLLSQDRSRRLLLERHTTFPAELSGGPHLLTTVGTGSHQFGPAFFAELHALRALKSTARTVHEVSLLFLAPQSKEKMRRSHALPRSPRAALLQPRLTQSSEC